MKPGVPSDDEIISQVRDAFANCSPPIPFDSIESGDFTSGHRLIALIDFLRDGKAVLGTKKMNLFQLQPMLGKALGSIAGRATPPSFNIQTIVGGDKAETLKILRWILSTRKPATISPSMAWVIRMGIVREPAINAEVIKAIAERFGLNGNPLEAFRNAGIAVPDDPSGALAAIFRASRGKLPGEIMFICDAESEAQLARIQAVITNIAGRSAASMVGETKSLTDTLTAVQQLKSRFDFNRFTKELAERTNQTLQEADNVLNRTLRNIEFQEQRERQQNENAAKEAAAAFERKAAEADELITKMMALAARKMPDTIDGMETRVRSLTMESVVESVEAAASIVVHGTDQRIADLRRHFEEASKKVAQRRSELEQLIHSIQTEKRQKHANCFARIKAVLVRVETAIDQRTGSCEERCALLRDQVPALSEQKMFVIQQGSSLDNDIRAHKVFDVEPIAPLAAEIHRLREKVRSSIADEIEIEKRRCHFSLTLQRGNGRFGYLEERIKSVALAPLSTARANKTFVIESEASIQQYGQNADEAWAALTAMRSFPVEPITDLRGWSVRLIALCKSTLLQLDEAIPRLEAQGIADFLSQIEICRSAVQQAEIRYAALPAEPRLRISGLSEIENNLAPQIWKSSDLFQWLRVHDLHQRIETHDAESVPAFRSVICRYGRERSRFTNYMSSLDTFHQAARYFASSIPEVVQEADRLMTTSNRIENIMIFQNIIARNAGILEHFWGVGDAAIARAHDCGQSDENVTTTRNRLREQYNDALTYARGLINRLTPQNASVSEEEPELAQPNPSERIRLYVRRDTAVDQFVSLALDNYESYCGQGLTISFSGEDGIDCGGPRREFFAMISAPLLRRKLVPAGAGDVLWFPDNEACGADYVNDLIAVGFFLRLTIATQQSVTSLLPLSFFHALKEQPMTLADLKLIHPEVFAGIAQAEEAYNHGETVDLYMSDGREVTANLFHAYVAETIKLLMETPISSAVEAVKQGFHGRTKPSWARSLSSEDLCKYVSGPMVVDWSEMKESCRYVAYAVTDIPVRLFWQVFDSLDEKRKVALLTFITASDRPPARGFASSPIKLVRCEWNPVAQLPFPRAHTCFNSLDLPNVTDEGSMRRLINIGIEYNAGFGFE